MVSECSLPSLQQTPTGRCPELDESGPHSYNLFSKIRFRNIKIQETVILFIFYEYKIWCLTFRKERIDSRCLRTGFRGEYLDV
jgi:hypothetical protein